MKQARKIGILLTITFIAVIVAASCCATAPETQSMKSKNIMKTLTVAKVIDAPENDYLKVLFLESARIYKLMRNNADFQMYYKILEKAEKNNSSVKVRLTEPQGDIIESVE